MNPPPTPMFTGQRDQDIELIKEYLFDLVKYLSEGEPDPNWSVTGLTTRKTLSNSDTLLQTQQTLGTVITSLRAKGLL